MKINELKRIAEENNYEYWELEYLHVFTKKYTNYFISISKNKEKRIWVKTPMMCDDKDFYMTKRRLNLLRHLQRIGKKKKKIRKTGLI